MSLPPNTGFLETPFSTQVVTMKMGSVSSVMVSGWTPSVPWEAQNWGSSPSSCGAGAVSHCPARPAGASGCSSGKAELSSLREWPCPVCAKGKLRGHQSHWHGWVGLGSCRSWEPGRCCTAGGGSCMSLRWHTLICFQRNTFGGCFIWLVSSGLLHSPEDDGWAQESCGTGKWTAWLLMCVVWASYAAASPAGLLHKHYMYYCQAGSIKRTFMKGNIRGNIIAGTL